MLTQNLLYYQHMYTCSFMLLFNQHIMWQQHNANNHVYTSQALQVTFTSNNANTMKKKCDLCNFYHGMDVA